MGDFSTLLYRWIERRKLKKTLAQVDIENQSNKGVVKYQLSDIEAFIERDPSVGSYIISGGSSHIRAKAISAAVACSAMQNIPVVILHEGDRSVERAIQSIGLPVGMLTIVNSASENYDPFYNRNAQEIGLLAINSQRDNIKITPVGQQYISGIAEFIQTKAAANYCRLFMTCPHEQLFEKIDNALAKGKLTDSQASHIKSLLLQGQTEVSNVRAFLDDLSTNCSGYLYQRKSSIIPCNIRSCVQNGEIVMIDIGSSANEVLLNVLIYEIQELLSNSKEIMLILDGISLNSNTALSKVIKSLSTRCHTVLSSDDVYSMLGADDNVFNTFVGNANQCLILTHTSGTACSKWADVIGHYNEKKISQNQGSTRHTMPENNPFLPWQGGYAAINQVSFSMSREYIVKPEEIAHLPNDQVYIIDQIRRELLNSTINT